MNYWIRTGGEALVGGGKRGTDPGGYEGSDSRREDDMWLVFRKLVQNLVGWYKSPRQRWADITKPVNTPENLSLRYFWLTLKTSAWFSARRLLQLRCWRMFYRLVVQRCESTSPFVSFFTQQTAECNIMIEEWLQRYSHSNALVWWDFLICRQQRPWFPSFFNATYPTNELALWALVEFKHLKCSRTGWDRSAAAQCRRVLGRDVFDCDWGAGEWCREVFKAL